MKSEENNQPLQGTNPDEPDSVLQAQIKKIDDELERLHEESGWKAFFQSLLPELPRLVLASCLWAIPVSIALIVFAGVLLKTGDPTAWSELVQKTRTLSASQWRAEAPALETGYFVFFLLSFGTAFFAGLREGPRHHKQACTLVLAVSLPGLLVLGFNWPSDWFLAGFVSVIAVLEVMLPAVRNRNAHS